MEWKTQEGDREKRSNVYTFIYFGKDSLERAEYRHIMKEILRHHTDIYFPIHFSGFLSTRRRTYIFKAMVKLMELKMIRVLVLPYTTHGGKRYLRVVCVAYIIASVISYKTLPTVLSTRGPKSTKILFEQILNVIPCRFSTSRFPRRVKKRRARKRLPSVRRRTLN